MIINLNMFYSFVEGELNDNVTSRLDVTQNTHEMTLVS